MPRGGFDPPDPAWRLPDPIGSRALRQFTDQLNAQVNASAAIVRLREQLSEQVLASIDTRRLTDELARVVYPPAELIELQELLTHQFRAQIDASEMLDGVTEQIQASIGANSSFQRSIQALLTPIRPPLHDWASILETLRVEVAAPTAEVEEALRAAAETVDDADKREDEQGWVPRMPSLQQTKLLASALLLLDCIAQTTASGTGTGELSPTATHATQAILALVAFLIQCIEMQNRGP